MSNDTTCPHCGKKIKAASWRDYLTETNSTRKLTFYSNKARDATVRAEITNVFVPAGISRDDLSAIMLLIEIDHRGDPFFRWGMAKENLMNYILRDGGPSVDP